MKILSALPALALLCNVAFAESHPIPLTNDSLKGVWTENINPFNHTGAFFGARQLKMIFTDSTFQYTLDYSTDVPDNYPPCINNLISWRNYVAGTYTVADTLLTLDGVYTDQSFAPVPVSSCTQGPMASGSFHETFRVFLDQGWLVFVASTGGSHYMYKDGHMPVTLAKPAPPGLRLRAGPAHSVDGKMHDQGGAGRPIILF
jgi:hypothetical protein